MVVRGVIRAISGSTAGCDTEEAAHVVRAVKAAVRPEVLHGNLGWNPLIQVVLALDGMFQTLTKTLLWLVPT